MTEEERSKVRHLDEAKEVQVQRPWRCVFSVTINSRTRLSRTWPRHFLASYEHGGTVNSGETPLDEGLTRDK